MTTRYIYEAARLDHYNGKLHKLFTAQQLQTLLQLVQLQGQHLSIIKEAVLKEILGCPKTYFLDFSEIYTYVSPPTNIRDGNISTERLAISYLIENSPETKIVLPQGTLTELKSFLDKLSRTSYFTFNTEAQIENESNFQALKNNVENDSLGLERLQRVLNHPGLDGTYSAPEDEDDLFARMLNTLTRLGRQRHASRITNTRDITDARNIADVINARKLSKTFNSYLVTDTRLLFSPEISAAANTGEHTSSVLWQPLTATYASLIDNKFKGNAALNWILEALTVLENMEVSLNESMHMSMHRFHSPDVINDLDFIVELTSSKPELLKKFSDDFASQFYAYIADPFGDIFTKFEKFWLADSRFNNDPQLSSTIEDSKDRIKKLNSTLQWLASQTPDNNALRNVQKIPLPKVFISYASEDREVALKLYSFLVENGCQPWLDIRNLLPGQKWEDEIEIAIEKCDCFIACLSSTSVSKVGYVQKEFKKALDILQMQPEGKIYLIPLRLDDCGVPRFLSSYEWVDWNDPQSRQRILLSIHSRKL